MIKRSIGRAVLRMSGWALEGPLPSARRYVLIAAPHTSNWDFVFMIAMSWVTGVRLAWMGKASLFVFPFGALMRAMGGIPIRRDRRASLVEQCTERFAAEADLVLAVPAEGTRRRERTWRSGFYHIARRAGVPVVLGYLDYARRRGGLGPEVWPSGDVRADMDRVRAFYADKVGRHPGRFTPPRLADEDQPLSASPGGESSGIAPSVPPSSPVRE
ncbi:MAG: lysophospholipid acyltransferase family protein [Rubrivivax sp.]|nr:lysophospholipid acyltransferase family protein [Rubrivivax sp.]